jgi:SnoaL-like domain
MCRDTDEQLRQRRSADRGEIRQLADRYGVAVDSKDLESLSLLFDEDSSFGSWGTGPKACKVFYDNILRYFYASMHMVGNHVVDFDDDDHAHGVVYCHAHHRYVEPDHWADLAMVYFDTYLRRDGTWRFLARVPKSFYRQTFGHPERGTERSLSTGDAGPVKGTQLPEFFPTFNGFWEREPAPKLQAPS